MRRARRPAPLCHPDPHSPRLPRTDHPECDYDDSHLCNDVPTGEQKPAAVLAANPELRKQAYRTCRERLDTFLIVARCAARRPVPRLLHCCRRRGLSRRRYLRFRECVDAVEKKRGAAPGDRGYVNPPDHRRDGAKLDKVIKAERKALAEQPLEFVPPEQEPRERSKSPALEEFEPQQQRQRSNTV